MTTALQAAVHREADAHRLHLRNPDDLDAFMAWRVAFHERNHALGRELGPRALADPAGVGLILATAAVGAIGALGLVAAALMGALA